jgi:hypothetical protein
MAPKRQLQPAAQRRAVDRRYHRFGRSLDPGDDLRQQRLRGRAPELCDVRARGKEPPGAGEHDGFHARVGIGIGKRLGQTRPHRVAERVHRRIVDAENRDLALPLSPDDGHDCALLCWTFPCRACLAQTMGGGYSSEQESARRLRPCCAG